MSELIFKVVQDEDPWICFQCKSAVRNFVVENHTTMKDHVQAVVVEMDEEMKELCETVGLEVSPASVVDACEHDRYMRGWCRQWRLHKKRLNIVSNIIDHRLMDIDHCLGEWDKISQEYEEAGTDREKRSKMLWRLIEFKKNFKDMLYKEGPGADQTFREEMERMRKFRDHLLAGLPKIKEGIINTPTAAQERLLKIIKAQSDRFEASGVQTGPDEWTITSFYSEIKAACDEANEKGQKPKTPEETNKRLSSSDLQYEQYLANIRPAKVIVPPGYRVVPTSSEAHGSQAHDKSAVAADSNTLFIDVACLLKLFTTVNSVPKTVYEKSPVQLSEVVNIRQVATDTADTANTAGTADTADTADDSDTAEDADSAGPSNQRTAELRASQIAKIDTHIRKLERTRLGTIKSIKKIKKTLGEILHTEMKSDDEHDSEPECSDVEMAE